MFSKSVQESNDAMYEDMMHPNTILSRHSLSLLNTAHCHYRLTFKTYASMAKNLIYSVNTCRNINFLKNIWNAAIEWSQDFNFIYVRVTKIFHRKTWMHIPLHPLSSFHIWIYMTKNVVTFQVTRPTNLKDDARSTWCTPFRVGFAAILGPIFIKHTPSISQ